jgi:hypothetical protein
MMYDSLFPPEAKPHEVAIMILYALGERDPKKIAQRLHYPTCDTVWRVFRDYKEELPSLRQGGFIGPGLVRSSTSYFS